MEIIGIMHMVVRVIGLATASAQQQEHVLVLWNAQEDIQRVVVRASVQIW